MIRSVAVIAFFASLFAVSLAKDFHQIRPTSHRHPNSGSGRRTSNRTSHDRQISPSKDRQISSNGQLVAVEQCLVDFSLSDKEQWKSWNDGDLKDCVQLANVASSDGIVVCSSLGYVDRYSGYYGGALHVLQIGSGYGRRSGTETQANAQSRKSKQSSFSLRMNSYDGPTISSKSIQLSSSCRSGGIQHLTSLHYNAHLPSEYSGDTSLLMPHLSLDRSSLRLAIVKMGLSRGCHSSRWGLYRGLPNSGSLVADEICIIKVTDEDNSDNHSYEGKDQSNGNSGTTTVSAKDESTTSTSGLLGTSIPSLSGSAASVEEQGSGQSGGNGAKIVSSGTTQVAAPGAAASATAAASSSTLSSSSIIPSTTIVAPVSAAQAQGAAASTTAFQLPGRSLQVLPIGLGIFAGVSVLALVIVGIVTYERKKYRRQFRARKAAGSQRIPDYGTDSVPRMGWEQ